MILDFIKFTNRYFIGNRAMKKNRYGFAKRNGVIF